MCKPRWILFTSLLVYLSMCPLWSQQIERLVAIDNVCAWPNLTQLKDGSLTATIFNRPHHGKGEGDHYGIGYRVSKDQGRTWNAPGHLVHLEGTRDGGYPATLQLGDGTLVTAYYSSGVVQHRRYHMGVVRWTMPD